MSAHPVVVPGVAGYPLFAGARGEGTWILGHAELDRYLTVPESLLPVLGRAAHLLDGTRSATQVRFSIREEFARDLDVDEFVSRLGAAGLLLGRDGKPPKLQRGTRLATLDLGEAGLGRAAQRVRRYARWLPTAWFAALGLIAVISVAWLAVYGAEMRPVAPEPRFASVLFAGAILSLLAHELSHALAALRRGLIPQSITVSLYLGFVPIVYLRIPGLYTLPPAERIRVWCSGSVANLSIAAAAFALQGEVPATSGWAGVLSGLALWNLAVFKLNLLPFLPTDGYFVLSTLLRDTNLRAKSYQTLIGWVRGRSGAVRWWVAAYAIGTLWVTLHMALGLGYWLVARAGAAGGAALLLHLVPFALWSTVVLARRRTRTAWAFRSPLRSRASWTFGAVPSGESHHNSAKEFRCRTTRCKR